jgi:hypothetical protein
VYISPYIESWSYLPLVQPLHNRFLYRSRHFKKGLAFSLLKVNKILNKVRPVIHIIIYVFLVARHKHSLPYHYSLLLGCPIGCTPALHLVGILLKGTVSRDFLLLVFFMHQFPPSPRVFRLDHFEFFRKFAEIFASQGAPPVSTTPLANLPPV